MRIVGAVMAIVGLAALFVPIWPAVSIGPDGGQPLTVFPLQAEESFSMRFVHSIDGLPIVEQYKLDGRDLVQIETRLLSFGIGTGYIAGDGVITEDGDWVVISDMRRRIGRLRQRIGVASVDHTLIWRERSLPLSRLFPGTLLVIEGTRMSLYDCMRWRTTWPAEM